MQTLRSEPSAEVQRCRACTQNQVQRCKGAEPGLSALGAARCSPSSSSSSSSSSASSPWPWPSPSPPPSPSPSPLARPGGRGGGRGRCRDAEPTLRTRRRGAEAQSLHSEPGADAQRCRACTQNQVQRCRGAEPALRTKCRGAEVQSLHSEPSARVNAAASKKPPSALLREREPTPSPTERSVNFWHGGYSRSKQEASLCVVALQFAFPLVVRIMLTLPAAVSALLGM